MINEKQIANNPLLKSQNLSPDQSKTDKTSEKSTRLMFSCQTELPLSDKL